MLLLLFRLCPLKDARQMELIFFILLLHEFVHGIWCLIDNFLVKHVYKYQTLETTRVALQEKCPFSTLKGNNAF